MTIDAKSAWIDIVKIRDKAPLVHNITNYVVMNSTANALLALGASPVMAHAEEEVTDMVKIASALVINIGTLSPAWIRAMFTAMRQAKELNVPIVLDPVGAGATPYRTNTIHELITATTPTIIRGNGSEINAIVMAEAKTRGVDSTISSAGAVEAARQLSKTYNCVVCVSGATDYIVQDERVVKIQNGHGLMARVTGLGCTASALCGAFAAVNGSSLAATSHAMTVMGIAGELAALHADGPGSLQMHFLDALYNLTEKNITDHAHIEA
jgi:hydroxyethylthiazole kinase